MKRRISIVQRFWKHVEITPSCWLWTASVISTGYGQIFSEPGKMMLAHRLSYELHVGPIPPGSELDHLCRNPKCVNPEHLEAVSHYENVRRGESGSARNARKTHCPKGHPYSGANLLVGRSGARRCRECCRRACRAYWLVKKTERLS
jgi:hypothetical protein